MNKDKKPMNIEEIIKRLNDVGIEVGDFDENSRFTDDTVGITTFATEQEARAYSQEITRKRQKILSQIEQASQNPDIEDN